MAAKNEGPSIGIDLGTTYSCVGVWQHDRVEIIANDQGNRTTPSYVGFTDTERLIGDAAKNQVAMNPINTVFGKLLDPDLSRADRCCFLFWYNWRYLLCFFSNLLIKGSVFIVWFDRSGLIMRELLPTLFDFRVYREILFFWGAICCVYSILNSLWFTMF